MAFKKTFLNLSCAGKHIVELQLCGFTFESVHIYGSIWYIVFREVLSMLMLIILERDHAIYIASVSEMLCPLSRIVYEFTPIDLNFKKISQTNRYFAS